MDWISPARAVWCGVAAAMALAADAAAGPVDLSATLDGVRQRASAPALAGAIVRGGEVTGRGVCGVRAAGEPDAAEIGDLWPIGSCTKPITRLMLARLAERGELDLAAPLSALLPHAPMHRAYRDATLQQVVTHRAGIAPYTRISPRETPEVFAAEGTPTEQRTGFVLHVLSLEPTAEPGTRSIYSNAGYTIAAAAAEHATGKSWEELVRSEVFVPLGLRSAMAGAAASDAVAADGHRRTPAGFERTRQRMGRLATMAPAGSVCLDIADFARYAGVHADVEAGRATAGLPAAATRRLAELRPSDATPGRGAFFGGDGLYTAAFAVWPEQGAAIAVASNAGGSDDLCQAAIEAIRAAHAPDLPPLDTGGSAPEQGGKPRWGFVVRAEDDGGWTVQDVAPDSIAARAGLKAGDRIVAMNGRELRELDEQARGGMTASDSLALIVVRGEEEERADVNMRR